ncbi:unnamed protein product [Oppiella nova]|uniref:Nudix hydrolase domain-containing protein n=1 Tax=Oppiella nova TaxID=334625 RepID=A0A7R9LYF2_9ACAR|nr:unnamed protein product [Oppiella nova]CAG2167530.1 unnamed protein product [Oppiella nova]
MDSLDTQIETILNGQPLPQDISVICDYNPWHQFSRSELKPTLRKNVYYIAAAIVFNENMDVLMVRESKPKYRGKWSLPSGRAEPNEQIIDTIRREVLEESGLEIAPTALVMMETSSKYVFNFVFTGRVIGGQLKTVADSDSESIEAKWCSQTDICSMNLRYEDTLDVISVVRNYNRSVAAIPYHISRFTAIGAHNRMLLRVVFTVKREQNHYILISKPPSPHLPEIFINEYPADSLLGVLSVEHNGVPKHSHDGLCITVLAKSRVPYEGVGRICGDYEWMQMSPPLEALLTRCLDNPMTELIQWRSKHWNTRR